MFMCFQKCKMKVTLLHDVQKANSATTTKQNKQINKKQTKPWLRKTEQLRHLPEYSGACGHPEDVLPPVPVSLYPPFPL